MAVLVECICRAHGCKRLLSKFDGKPGETLCPECAARYAKAMRPTLHESAQWVHVEGGYKRRDWK